MYLTVGSGYGILLVDKKRRTYMSDINHETVIEQIAENLAEELDREPTEAEIRAEIEKRNVEVN